MKIQEKNILKEANGESIYIQHSDLSFLKSVENIHLASIFPNHIRGNHCHLHKDEIIIVYEFDSFQCYHIPIDSKENVVVDTFNFKNQAIFLYFPPLIAHAIKKYRHEGIKTIDVIGS